ncbi:15436_t:CDS:1, partial [Racocetra fulgida]
MTLPKPKVHKRKECIEDSLDSLTVREMVKQWRNNLEEDEEMSKEISEEEILEEKE